LRTKIQFYILFLV